jgi:hypothetical protein
MGEGIRIAVGIVAIGSICWLFVEAMAAIERGWAAMIERFPSDEDELAAEARVPELAASARAPDYKGRCRCRACRSRPYEPCSDFDD